MMSRLVACEGTTIYAARRTEIGMSIRSRTKLKSASEEPGNIFWLASSWQSITGLMRFGMMSGSIGAINSRVSNSSRSLKKYQSFLRKVRGMRRFSARPPVTAALTDREEYMTMASPAGGGGGGGGGETTHTKTTPRGAL